MENNFSKMTTGDLKKLQNLLTIEIHKREEEQKEKAKEEIYMLLNEIGAICEKYDISLYDYYHSEILISDVTIEG